MIKTCLHAKETNFDAKKRFFNTKEDTLYARNEFQCKKKQKIKAYNS